MSNIECEPANFNKLCSKLDHLDTRKSRKVTRIFLWKYLYREFFFLCIINRKIIEHGRLIKDVQERKTIYFYPLSFACIFLWFLSDDDYLYGSSSSVVSQYQSVDIKDKTLAAEIIFRGIEFPTSMAFLNKDDILVLEKNNDTVKRIMEGKMSHDPVTD